MPKNNKISEVELAAKVIEYLKDLGWEIYQEVEICGRVADIVAVQKPLYWIIECKTNFSLQLIEQGLNWRGFAHLISIASPHHKGKWIFELLRKEGIGYLEITTHYGGNVFEMIPASLNHHCEFVKYLKNACIEERKNFCPAGSKSGRWTPFKQTETDLKEFIGKHPGCTMKEAIEEITHHYRTDTSARQNLFQWINKGVIKGIVMYREGRQLKLKIGKLKIKTKE